MMDHNASVQTPEAAGEPAPGLLLFRAFPEPNIARVQPGKNGAPIARFPNSIVLPPSIERDLEGRGETIWYFQLSRPDIELPSHVINFCADCDTYGRALSWLSEKARQRKVSIFNHPDEVSKTRRDTISEVLTSIPDLTVPMCARFRPTLHKDFLTVFQQRGFSFPVLVRPAGSQTGEGLLKISGNNEWNELRKISWYDQNIYMTQYCEFRSPNGEYVKLRIANIGPDFVVKHVKVGGQWMVHNSSSEKDREKREHYIAGFDRDDRLKRIVTAIRKVIRLDFWGIDLGYDGKNYVLFEANPAMTMMSSDVAEEQVALPGDGAAPEAALLRKEVMSRMLRNHIADKDNWVCRPQAELVSTAG